MATRPYWTGQIRLSLVSIAVQIIPATKTAAKISFHQVHKPSGSRIRYEKVVPGVGAVDRDEIVKGYEVSDGKYVLLEDKDFDKIKLEAKKTIDLTQFVDAGDIDQLYFDRPFYVLPDDDEDGEAYVVLRDALKKTKKVGIGQIVIRGKGSLVAIKACGKGLMMETLRYADEVRKAESTFRDVPKTKPDAEMIELAEDIIGRKSKAFDPAAFHDKYEDALHELIEAKQKHRQVRQIEEPQPSAKIIDLMDALRKSAKGGGKSGANDNAKSGAKPKTAKASRTKRAVKRSSGKSKRKKAAGKSRRKAA
ncbi:MAG: Ku protein [Xanthobacteraceae bacterium]|uniref:non-homologous end joining protein Ku n=1 Tax=Pseudolabrys sp. TaxID=1960880 RepID=UPI003D0D45E6